MKYVTGQHALNILTSLETAGDWHASALQWERPTIWESEGSFFGDYGIESGVPIPEHDEPFYVANHIRALLDLLIDNRLTVAQGMRDDFICNEEYTPEIFDKVWQLRHLDHWDKIDALMKREYKMEWVRYSQGQDRV